MNDQMRGTQHTRLKSDGRTIQTVFALALSPAHIEQATLQASGFLGQLPTVWYMDYSRVTAIDAGMNQILRKQFRAFREAGGKTVVALVPDSLRGCKILRTALASTALNSGIRLNLFETEKSALDYIADLNKL